eukprot:1393097-Amorphochlora_amoeboformis.AAC.3
MTVLDFLDTSNHPYLPPREDMGEAKARCPSPFSSKNAMRNPSHSSRILPNCPLKKHVSRSGYRSEEAIIKGKMRSGRASR